ncbi:MAG: MotA/TolQ/ExbB proton channel family protein [Oligoflexus sp.]
MEFNIVDTLLGMTLLGSEWVLWLLLILSVVSLAVMIERGIYFYKLKVDFPSISEDIAHKLVESDFDGIKAVCYANRGIETQTVLRGLEFKDKGATSMEQRMSSYVVGERQKLDAGLVFLGTLGNNAPFIGLFGTVIGIIQAFNDLADNPAGGPSVVMAGISEALVATAVGLLVAIPAVIAYNAYQRVVKRRISNADSLIKMLVGHFSK